MRIDAADRAKVVLRRVSVELIELEILRSFDDADAAQRYGGDDRAFAPANGAIAMSGIDNAIRQIQFQLHRAAMACSPMPGLYGDPANFLEHYLFLQ